MKALWLIAAALSASTAGCSSLPRYMSLPTPISADEIFDAVQCEIQALVGRSSFDYVKRWTGVANVNVTDTADVILKPGVAWNATVATPVVPVKVNAGPSGQYETKGVGVLKLKRNYDALGAQPVAVCPPASSPFAAKGLGIADYLAKKLDFIGGNPGAFEIDEFSFDRTFTVTRTVGGGLTFTASIFTVTANSNSASNQLQTEVKLGIAPAKGKSTKEVQQDIQRQLDLNDALRSLSDAISAAQSPAQ